MAQTVLLQAMMWHENPPHNTCPSLYRQIWHHEELPLAKAHAGKTTCAPMPALSLAAWPPGLHHAARRCALLVPSAHHEPCRTHAAYMRQRRRSLPRDMALIDVRAVSRVKRAHAGAPLGGTEQKGNASCAK